MWSSLPSFVAVYPETILVVVASAFVLLDRVIRNKDVFTWATLVTVGVTLVVVLATAGTGFGDAYAADQYGLFFKAIFLLVLFLATLISPGYGRVVGIHFGEYYGLMLYAAAGMMLMASAKDLILLYLGLEVMSLSVYVLVGLIYKDIRSLEGAMKYFLLGSFASAFLLLAITYIYGLTSSVKIETISHYIVEHGLLTNKALLFAIALFVVAFGFKVALVPFHMWAPDAYEGAPTSITAFMSVGPKAAGFAAMGRVFLIALGAAKLGWEHFFIPLAIVTLFVGTALTVVQTNIKRMLAYSSVAHAGYAMLGIIAGTKEGMAATMMYLFIYAFMNIGAFGVIILLRRKDFLGESIFDFQGLSKTHPTAALLMLLFMFSLAGIPPTAGFIGKFFVFRAAFEAGHPLLVICAVLASCIAAYPYLRVVMLMYMKPPEQEVTLNLTGYLFVSLAISLAGVLVFGVWPGPLIDFARSCCAGFLP